MKKYQAIEVLNNLKSSYTEKFRATAVLVDSKDVIPEDLLICLLEKGLIAEIAALKLYKLTGRKLNEESPEILVDHEDWENYLNTIKRD